jgi:hypothetical protein
MVRADHLFITILTDQNPGPSPYGLLLWFYHTTIQQWRVYPDSCKLCANTYLDKIPVIDESVLIKTDWLDSVYNTELHAAPPNIPEPLGNPVVSSVFVDVDHAGNVVTRWSQTGILIYVNNAPLIWYAKKQNTVEAATYGSEFVAAWIAVELAEGLLYKLRMFSINIFCDNRSVINSSTKLEMRLTTKHLGICFHQVREACANGTTWVGKEDGVMNLSDLLTKLIDTTPKRWNILHILFPKGG